MAYSAPSHYLNQFWSIVNWTLRNKLQKKFCQNIILLIHKSASENNCLGNGGHFVQGEISWFPFFKYVSLGNPGSLSSSPFFFVYTYARYWTIIPWGWLCSCFSLIDKNHWCYSDSMVQQFSTTQSQLVSYVWYSPWSDLYEVYSECDRNISSLFAIHFVSNQVSVSWNLTQYWPQFLRNFHVKFQIGDYEFSKLALDWLASHHPTYKKPCWKILFN